MKRPSEALPIFAGRGRLAAGAQNPWVVFTGIAAIWLGALVWYWGALVNVDSAWYLVSTRRWLEGATLYVDVMELNPPLAFYLTVPALVMADVFGISEMTAFQVSILLLALLSISLVVWILAALRDQNPVASGVYVLSAFAVSIFAALPQTGQREHILVLCLLPYLTLFAFGRSGTPSLGLRIAVGTFAGLGLLLKPHFLLVPFLVSLARAGREGTVRSLFSLENWVIGILAVAYLAFIFVVHPEYVQDVVPLTLATYAGYDRPLAHLLYPNMMLVALAPLLLLLARRVRGIDVFPALTMIAAAVAMLVVYFVQGKGWYYHFVPSEIFAALACVALATAAIGRNAKLVALGLLPAVFLIGMKVFIFGLNRSQTAEILIAELGDRTRGKVFVALNAHMPVHFPYVNQSGAVWGLRYPALWPVPGTLTLLGSKSRTDRETGARIADRLRREVTADFRKFRPDYVLVQRRELVPSVPEDFDYISFLSEDPEFAAEWRSYRKLRELPLNEELWERVPLATRAGGVTARGGVSGQGTGGL